MADAQVSDACGQPCEFKSHRPHHANAPLWGAFLRVADEGKYEETVGSRKEGENPTTLSEGPLVGVSEIPFIRTKIKMSLFIKVDFI